MPSASKGTFETNEPLLHELLGQAGTGVLQLPDFQRGWVWDDDHIRALVASVTLSYPIGAVMLLETGGDGVRFQPRPLEGVELPTPPPQPRWLILDGQQRLTSLYLALFSDRPVPTRTEKGLDIERRYYLDLKACLDSETERMDAVVSVPADRVIRRDFGKEVVLDLRERNGEFALSYLPLPVVFDVATYQQWCDAYRAFHKYEPARMEFLRRFGEEVWVPLQQYKVPVIELKRGTPKEAVCQVFEKVNTGGVTLSVFELVTATFAAEDFRLRAEWEDRQKRLEAHATLEEFDATQFLTAVTLLATHDRAVTAGGAVSCKRRDVLKLDLADYRRLAPRVEGGLLAAARFLAREKVFGRKDLPYTTQLVPLAAICAALGDRFENDTVKKAVGRWYWSGVFGELYGSATESRFAADLPEVLRWLEGGEEPKTLRDSSFAPTRLLSLQSRLSAAYKGFAALTMREGGQDFLSGDPIDITRYFDLGIDIHHLFPQKHCEANGLKRTLWNSVVNKTPLSARTNRIIGGNAPSKYLGKIERDHQIKPERLDEILRTHFVEPGLLRSDDFPVFLRTRASRLLDLVESATGKAVQGRDADEVVGEFGGSLTDTQTPLKAP